MPKIFYVYVLIDPRTNQIVYVGKGHDYRSEVHRYLATEERHYNKKLQNKINKIRSCGLEIVSKIVFDSHCEDTVLMREASLICIIGLGNLCNLTANFKGGRFGMASPMKGRKHTEEAKQKVSTKLKGRPHSTEHNRKVALALKGRPFSGTPFDRKGTKNSSESNLKRRLAQLGKPKKKKRGPLSETHRQKLKEAWNRRKELGIPGHRKGKKNSSESNLKRRLAQLGKPKKRKEKGISTGNGKLSPLLPG